MPLVHNEEPPNWRWAYLGKMANLLSINLGLGCIISYLYITARGLLKLFPPLNKQPMIEYSPEILIHLIASSLQQALWELQFQFQSH